MGQIEDLRFFIHMVEAGGVSKAAEKLNIAKSAVSRRLSLLEARYDARLIERAPGSWRITQVGEELYQRATRAVGEVDEIDADFMSQSADLSGPLAVSVPNEFGLGYLMGTLIAFKTKYPEISLTIDYDDRFVDLSREHYDFAIRISESETPGAVHRPLGIVHHGLYASADYLRAHEMPQGLDDLHQHRMLYFGNARRASWTFLDGKGKSHSVEFQPYLNTNSGMFLLEAAKDGLGICRLPSFVVKDELSGEGLIRLLPNLHVPQRSIYLLHAANRRINRRMRVFAEEIVKACRDMK